ncbi:hypothetical protein ESZ53_08715 [Salinibacterium sp. UTAS2018]|uniref:hypothetical protein n=1 Tax=Salinibacterium sp. UTAS2018 TaxID=2508880 RepID=UPI0010093E02|nr:hypothetical protein [Salinibacterium sp. UTAS2018]QAV70511.1 hypothetical protein ESZ53_08715 [Salinibacterium sp. UTAS2018]
MAFALSDIDAPTEGQQWLLRAEELFAAEAFAPALSAALQAAHLTTGAVRVVALGIVATCCVRLGQLETAEAVALQRHTLLLELGKPLEAASQARTGLAFFGSAEPYDLAALERETMNGDELPPRLHALALLALADVLTRQPSAEKERLHSTAGLAYLQANAADDPGSTQFFAARHLMKIAFADGNAERMLEYSTMLLATARNRTAHAEANSFSAMALAGVGRASEALLAVNQAIDLYDAIDLPDRLYHTTILGGRMAVDAQERAIALGRFRDAIELAHELNLDDTEARKAVANLLVMTDSHPEAIAMLTEIYNHETTSGAPAEARAESLEFMAHSLAATKQLDSAIQVWTMAASLYTEVGALDDAARVTRSVAGIHTARDDHAAARSALLTAAAAVRESQGDGVIYLGVLHDLGTTQARLGDRDALTTFAEVEADTLANQAPWMWAATLAAKARALHILGDNQDAVAQATKAAAALRTANDPSGALHIERFAAGVLTEMGRPKDAIKLLKTVVKNARGDADMLAGANRELADCYDALGKKRRATGTRSLAGDA